jgi:hypothetical protein
MTLQQLKYFIETVNCGSINKAAERLFIAQPSLSNALRDLVSFTTITAFLCDLNTASLQNTEPIV